MEIVLKTKGTYHQGNDHWSSHHASVRFRAIYNNSKTRVVRVLVTQVYGQQGLSANAGYVRPRFNNQGFAALRQRAQRIFQDRLDGAPRRRNNNNNNHNTEPDKNHVQDKCERCRELGRNCTSKKG